MQKHFISKGANGYKPLVNRVTYNLNEKVITGLLPIVKNRQKVYDVNVSEEENFDDIVLLTFRV